MKSQGYYFINEVPNLILKFYEETDRKWPLAEQAVMWAMTELGEATDLILMRDAGWVRNNDREGFTQERFVEEHGDVIMMAMVAGMCVGGNPLKAMVEKLERKMADE